ncbi:MAG: ATP-binding protein [Desulfovibrionales bacterium]|nr:ATP-binding protein [Desulfovibrionales bacterium]
MTTTQKTTSPYRGKSIAIAVYAAMVLLLGGALFLSIFLEKQTRKIAVEQFNQQQLLLARYAARQLQNNLELICDELRVLNYSPSLQYLDPVAWARRIEITMSVLKQSGVLLISRIDQDGKKEYSVDNHGKHFILDVSHRAGLRDTLELASATDNKDKVFVSDAFRDEERYPGRLLLTMGIPTYQESIDEAHPVPTGNFVGITEVTLDITTFVKRIVMDIRSGETGYAWVIDDRGVFLYHPLAEFMGANAFEVRPKKAPKISFVRIHRIQKERMLAGREGTSWYISGWHRETKGPIEKLIAYTPVIVGHPGSRPSWSVAVVAPISEVEEVIKKDLTRLHVMHGVIVLSIIMVGLTAFMYERRWEKKLSEEVEEKTRSLRRSEERYRSLVENAEDMIYSLDRDGNIISINRYAINLLSGNLSGVPPGSIEGRNFLKMCVCDKLNLATIHRIFDAGEPQDLEHRAEIGGKEYWFSTHLIPIKDTTGVVRALLGISRDVTEQNKMAGQMANTEKLASLGLLAAGVAHEINNPIAIIMGFSEVLLEKCPPGDERHDMLKRIIHQAQVCERIVSQLLSFSRASEYAEDLTDINQELGNIIKVVGNTLLMKKIKVNLDLVPDLPKVKADPTQVQQVFLNLINNAIGAMPGGGDLAVSTAFDTDNNLVRICFSDTGCGIPPESRTKIFDPFFTTKRTGEGTGLGLTVSYNIVNGYGGTINFITKTAEEAGDKKGTTFIVSLPAFLCSFDR